MLILGLLPHFLLGFAVEAGLGSIRYGLALLASGTITNILTIFVILAVNAVHKLPRTYVFASSAPIVLLCISCWNLVIPKPAGSKNTFGAIFSLVALVLYFIRALFRSPVDLISLLIAIVVNYGVLIGLDSTVTFASYVRSSVPKGFGGAEASLLEGGAERQRGLEELAKDDDEKEPFTVSV
jgi:hypothetical protein